MHGIGGHTIAEAKENVSHAEAMRWLEYLEQRGSLNLGTRMESGFALLAVIMAKGFKLKHHTGRDLKIEDFLPHADKDQGELTMESVILAFGKIL